MRVGKVAAAGSYNFRTAPEEARMRAKLFAVGLSVATVLAGAAQAQAPAQQPTQTQDSDATWRQCANGIVDPVAAIKACNAIIQSGQESRANLSRAFVNRSTAHAGKGRNDLAIDAT